MTDKITAPFTAEQVENLNRTQHFGLFHGFTCGRDHPEPRRLVATTAGWVCPRERCRYTQTWAHAAMADFTKAAEDEARVAAIARGFKV